MKIVKSARVYLSTNNSLALVHISSKMMGNEVMCNPSIVVSPKGSRGQGATALPYLDKIEQIKFVYSMNKISL